MSLPPFYKACSCLPFPTYYGTGSLPTVEFYRTVIIIISYRYIPRYGTCKRALGLQARTCRVYLRDGSEVGKNKRVARSPTHSLMALRAARREALSSWWRPRRFGLLLFLCLCSRNTGFVGLGVRRRAALVCNQVAPAAGARRRSSSSSSSSSGERVRQAAARMALHRPHSGWPSDPSRSPWQIVATTRCRVPVACDEPPPDADLASAWLGESAVRAQLLRLLRPVLTNLTHGLCPPTRRRRAGVRAWE